jgi:hypothetical protein
METHAESKQSVFIDAAAQSHDAVSAEELRSEKNILRWQAYLPQDCIERMIEMGWDITT